MYSKDSFGNKNGAHYILSKKFLEGAEPKKTLFVIDKCTNVHTKKDLINVKKNLEIKKL